MRRAILLSVLLVVSGASTPVRAQRASDKATARELASAGIQEFKAGNTQEALRKLEKAQALFDAPIHLLYLARAQAQLGKLVEAAEYYRSLARVELDASSTKIFRQAQEDGVLELAELEPRLAHLTIEVSPAHVEGLEIFVDGRPMNVAILAVARASNPGTREVMVNAPGYEDAEAAVELGEGDTQTLQLVLTKAETEAPRDGTSSKSKNNLGKNQAADKTSSTRDSGPMGFVLGARFGAMVPFGQLDTTIPTGDYFHAGLAGRVDAGFRFARYFGVKLFIDLASMNPGSSLDQRADKLGGVTSKSTASVTDAGFSLFATSDPRQLGAYGELGFSLLHQYQWSIQRKGAAITDCENSAKYSGTAFRVGGGLNVPIARFLNLVPSVDIGFGQHRNITTTYGCLPLGEEPPFPPESSLNKALHFQLFFGLGGDFHFGDSLFQ